MTKATKKKKSSKRSKRTTRKRLEKPAPEETPTEDLYGVGRKTKTFSSGCTMLDLVLGGGWAYSRIGNIIGDNCISGEAVVSVSRDGGHAKKMPLASLYSRFHGLHHNAKPGASTRVLCDMGGYVALMPVADVRKSGVKPVLRITDSLGGVVEATADHKFKTSKGWMTVNSGMSVGDHVHVWRGKATGKADRKDRGVTYSIRYHPHGWQHLIAGVNYKRMVTARLVIEAEMNGLSLEEFIRILRTDAVTSATLSYCDAGVRVHHLDGDPSNDSLDNLQLLEAVDHALEHGEDFAKNTNRTQMAMIVSIEEVGEVETYDISMAQDPHNFIADGFVVHNSTGKTLLAIEACANFAQENPDADIVYAETEAAFDPEYATDLGLPVDRVEFPEVYTVEELHDDIEKRLDNTDKKTLYVIDSLDALSDEREQKRNITDGTYGTKAATLSTWMRKQNKRIAASNVTILIVSQVRENIGVMFGKKYKRSGGKAMDFYATHCLWLAKIKTLSNTRNKVKRAYGVRVKAKAEKNKLGPPFRECEFELHFGYGVADVEASLDFLINVERHDLLDMSKDVATKLLKKLPGMDYDEYEEHKNRINAAAAKAWQTIEDDFKPKRRKY